MDHPLYVAIVWHMHQPYYRDLRTGEIPLPWVRLHAAKDYLHMGQVLRQHPDVHLTINMVPSLTEQMLAWADGRADDELVQLAEQRGWSEAEKRLILNLCYSISWDNVIRRYPRFSELLDCRPQAMANPHTFSSGDYRDLLAWFNLAWIDPNWLERDRVLAGLVAKRHGYSATDLRLIHDKQREIAAGILPLYRQLADAGQLEISASPYYHPILPLLIDSSSARRASTDLPLPGLHLHAAEDAAAQLQSAVAAHTHHFGSPPRGLWPAEGALSFEALPFIQSAGFEWLASDEAVLAASLGQPLHRDGSGMLQQPHLLYKPYRVMAGANLGPWIVFRDHELSDRIGFLYHRLPGQQAAEDMVYRLLEIRKRLKDTTRPYLVTIILDGENCWENYEHNGDVFLHALYGMLAERGQRNELAAVTVGEYLAAHAGGGTLARLATGSWISGDLTTWIGDPEHNRAWEALIRTRAHVRQAAGACQPDAPAAEDPAQDGLPAPFGAPGSAGPGVTAGHATAMSPAGLGGDTAGQPVLPAPAAAPAGAAVEQSAPPAGTSLTASPAPPDGQSGGADVADRPAGASFPQAAHGSGDFADSQSGAAMPHGQEPDLAAAWRALYVAEGSDWFWWYSHRNHSDQDAVYDKLFRDALAAAYAALGQEAPAWLEQPIGQMPARAAAHGATGYVSPQLTAAPYPGEAWRLAAALQPADVSTGAMQRAGGAIQRLFVGHDPNSLYLRLDLRDWVAAYDVAIYLGAGPGWPVNQRLRAHGGEPGAGGFALGWEIALPAGQSAPFLYRAAGYDQWQAVGPLTAAVGDKVLEAAVSLNVLGLETGRDLSVVAGLARDGVVRAQLPEHGMAVFSLQHF